MEFREQVPLSSQTTFEIGGIARYFVEVNSEDELHEALMWARVRSIPIFILAGGSNLLIPDDGIDGLVIKVVMDRWSFSGLILEAQAGSDLLGLIRAGAMIGVGGWEKLAGIPGTIGGAVRGNAGAFGPEIKDFIDTVRCVNTTTFESREFSNAECEFSYRMSFFKKHPELIIMSVRLQLQKTDPKESATIITDTIAERERRHIQNVRAAGSYFKNPVVSDDVREMFESDKNVKSREGRVPAGWLIEQAGMKGAKVGGAQASEQHPNYLVNADNATAADVRALADKIKKAVFEKFKVHLEEEAVIFSR